MASIGEYGLLLSSTQSSEAAVDLTALVETHAALLFRVAHSILRSRAEAEDVVQDVFVRVLEHRANLSAVRDMRVWLTRIAWNLALDRTRRIRPEQLDQRFAESVAAVYAPADRQIDEVRRVAAALAEIERLPKTERHVLLLAAIEEFNSAEMAAVLGKSESAVRALLFRARARLRERLESRKPGRGGPGKGETGKGETGKGETGKCRLGKGRPGKGGPGNGETGKGLTGKGETGGKGGSA